MSFHKFLLYESLQPEEIRKKYYNDISPEIFIRLSKVDPKSKVVDGELVKVGPFVKFIIRDYKNGIFKFEDADRYTEYIDLYFKNRSRRELRGFDILKIDSIYDLIEKLQFLKGEKTGEIYDLLKTIVLGKDYQKLGETDNWLIYSPKTEKGACTLGYGTEWCTAWGKMSLDKNKQGRTNVFNNYKDDLIVLVSKETKKPTWQIHLRTNQFMDMNDRNLMSGPVGGYQSVKEFFAKNLKVIYYVIPELRDLNNLSRNNIMQLTKYMSLYPSVISEKIFNAFNEYIPKEIHKGLSRMMEDPSSENVESIMTKIFGKNPLKSVWGEVVIDESALDNELTDVVRMTYRGGFFETDNMPEDEFIEESISDVLEKSLKNPQDDLTQLIRSMTPLIKNDFDLNYLSMLLGKEKYENLINEVGYRYSEKENNSYRIQQEGIVSKIREIVSVPYQDGIEFENSDYFFGLLKGFMVSEVYEEGETLDFNDFISEIFSMNDIPLSITDFYETIYENAYQNFNIEEFKDDVHHEIYSALDYKFNEMKEEGITPNQLSKLYNILKDLNFNPSTNEIDNEIANIKVFPETSDIKKETVKIQFTNKQNPDESYTGTVSYDDIAKYATNYQLFENIIRIRKLIMG
jgi:hypothetical protein